MTNTIKTSISHDELSLRRWDALAATYEMPNATVLWHIINLTDIDAAVAGDWRSYLASHPYKCSGPLRSIRLDINAGTAQSLVNIQRRIKRRTNQSEIIRQILAFWGQFAKEQIAC